MWSSAICSPVEDDRHRLIRVLGNERQKEALSVVGGDKTAVGDYAWNLEQLMRSAGLESLPEFDINGHQLLVR